MFTSIYSGAVCGIEGRVICVEADISNGFPTYSLVGYLASEVKEARERVTAALKNSGYPMPAKKIIINLSPAGMRKQGTAYDLPIALALLGSLGIIPQKKLENVFAVGELSLDGSIRPVKGILSQVLMAKKHGFASCIVPVSNLREASLAKSAGEELPNIIGVASLQAACAFFSGAGCVEGIFTSLPEDRQSGGLSDGAAPVCVRGTPGDAGMTDDAGIAGCARIADGAGIMPAVPGIAGNPGVAGGDFSEIVGQEVLKRAIVVAVSGMHHLLMIGPPGSGKSMSARAIQGILPPLTFEESLEVTQLYSVAGILGQDCALVTRRPFRSPHHTVTVKAMTGGGQIATPGEISLAHRGILFLDELAEFPPALLEILRQPLEEGIITINRLHGSYVFPARFMLVAAMNPCKCGYYPDKNRCHCTSAEIYHYLHRISRPLWNRIDVCVEVHPPVKNIYQKEDIFNKKKQDLFLNRSGLDSRTMARMVREARQIQVARFQGSGIYFNSEMPAALLEKYCLMDKDARGYADQLAQTLDLNMRGRHKLLKVARTIADLEGSELIYREHLDEAACYRMIEQSYWES